MGGDFGTATTFPNDQQAYYFADFVQGWINRALLDSTGSAIQSVQSFATNLGGSNVTDIVGGPDGSLYYATYSGNAVRKITALEAIARRSPSPRQRRRGQPAAHGAVLERRVSTRTATPSPSAGASATAPRPRRPQTRRTLSERRPLHGDAHGE